MNTIRLILGLMIGGIEVAAGRRKGAVSSYIQARERTTGPAWRAGRPLSGKNSALASWAQSGGFGVVAKIQRRITAKEREAIHAGLAQGKSGAQLAVGPSAPRATKSPTRPPCATRCWPCLPPALRPSQSKSP
ncbi:MAG: hypothetical protein J6386_08825 [Candidatus Synoicihabitans palmerolidicus]|nr:hypothetical protein [Candidatus Synoicihabitans palmerolidicus]